MEKTEKLLIKDIINEITEEANEVLKEANEGDYKNGQLLAYATALSIIRDIILGDELKEYNLDYDIDKKYLLDK